MEKSDALALDIFNVRNFAHTRLSDMGAGTGRPVGGVLAPCANSPVLSAGSFVSCRHVPVWLGDSLAMPGLGLLSYGSVWLGRGCASVDDGVASPEHTPARRGDIPDASDARLARTWNRSPHPTTHQ